MRRVEYKHYLLIVLTIILTSNYLDRVALGLVLQEIKVEIGLSDTQLGFLTGIAFALFYSFMGIPIAWWADRGNRVRIIALTTAIWSVMVCLCGSATSFTQLLLIRIGVAVGEAGCIPPAHSLIADYFNRSERPRAVAVYMLGGSFSAVIGYFLGGWANEFYGWRATFVILGLPGLFLAALVWRTLKEPRNQPRAANLAAFTSGKLDSDDTVETTQTRVVDVLSMLWHTASLRHLLLCFSILCFFSFGIGQWLPAFFVRSYGLKTGELGTWFAVINGFGGILGTYAGGELASRFARNNERLQLKAMAAAFSFFSVVYASVYVVRDQHLAFALMGLATTGGCATMGPMFATIQGLVPQRMRAVAIAIIYLFGNLIGLGLGPLVVGGLSDALRPGWSEESLRYALLAMCPGFLWGAWHSWRASKTVARDLEAAESGGGRVSGVRNVQLRSPTGPSASGCA